MYSNKNKKNETEYRRNQQRSMGKDMYTLRTMLSQQISPKKYRYRRSNQHM